MKTTCKNDEMLKAPISSANENMQNWTKVKITIEGKFPKMENITASTHMVKMADRM